MTASKAYQLRQKFVATIVFDTDSNIISDESSALAFLEDRLDDWPSLERITVVNGGEPDPGKVKRAYTKGKNVARWKRTKPRDELTEFKSEEKRRGYRRTWVPKHETINRQGNPTICKGHYRWFPVKHKKHGSQKKHSSQIPDRPVGPKDYHGQDMIRPGYIWIKPSSYTNRGGVLVKVPGNWRKKMSPKALAATVARRNATRNARKLAKMNDRRL